MGSAGAASRLLPARYYARLGLLLAEQGVALTRLLHQARLPARRLLDPDGRLSLAEVERLSRHALALYPGRDLGWRLGARIPPAEHATLGHALLAAPTLDDAMRLAARYFALLSPGFVLRYRLDSDSGEVSVVPRLAFGREALRLHLDVILIALLAELEHLHGRPLSGLQIACALPAPASPQRQPLLRRHRCRFDLGGLPQLSLRLPAALLRAPRPAVDRSAQSAARQRLEQQRDSLRLHGGLSEWTLMMLRECEGGLPTQAELAGLLGLSPRRFARGLAREGSALRDLSTAVRMTRAQEALIAGELSITELAFALGYTDLANFSRAFRRAVGCSPRAFRQSRR